MSASASAPPASVSTKLLRAAETIRAACEQHGLDQARLTALLGRTPELRSAIGFIYGARSVVPQAAVMRLLVREAQKVLDLAEPLQVELAHPARRIAHVVRAVFAAAILLLSGWIVIGSIVVGENEFAQATTPGIAILGLCAALFVLALLEAAHIGAVALSTADVSTLAQTHPRVVVLHRHIDTKAKLEQYLAARQVGVVLVVFLVSELTRTANLTTLPGTQLEFPSALDVLLRIGVPGALIVLVLGQVTPQIVTARRPAAMMNLFPMAAAFHFTRFIGMLGLARPASWLVAWASKTERIPTAPRERYIANSQDVDGYGVVAINRDVVVTASGTRSETVTAIAFAEHAPSHLALNVAASPTAPSKLKVEAHLLTRDEPLEVTEITELKLLSLGGSLFGSVIYPRAGAFTDSDVLVVQTALEVSDCAAEDFVSIDLPTKLVTLRVLLEHPPVPLPSIAFEAVRTTDGEITLLERLPVTTRVDGSVEAIATAYYPDPGTTLRLRWGATDPLGTLNAFRTSLEAAR